MFDQVQYNKLPVERDRLPELTEQEIFDQTFTFIYNQGPAFKKVTSKHVTCAYLNSDGRMCAVGVWLHNPQNYTGFVSERFPDYITSRLELFEYLQRAHDESVFFAYNEVEVSLAAFRREYVMHMKRVASAKRLSTSVIELKENNND